MVLLWGRGGQVRLAINALEQMKGKTCTAGLLNIPIYNEVSMMIA